MAGDGENMASGSALASGELLQNYHPNCSTQYQTNMNILKLLLLAEACWTGGPARNEA